MFNYDYQTFNIFGVGAKTDVLLGKQFGNK